jgi:hypothetical protein
MRSNETTGISGWLRPPIAALLVAALFFAAPAGAFGDRPLNDAISRAGKSVEVFWQQFSSITCTENVTQEKLGLQGKVEYRQQSAFDYLILMSLKGDDLTVDESRLLQKSEGKSKNLPLLTTAGFPTLLLVFHPYYQQSYRYDFDGDEVARGRKMVRVKFEHIPGTRSTSAIALRGREYALDLRGTAWIDEETGVIQKMSAGLIAPMDDLNLKALNTEVVYEAQRFPESPDQAYWLPLTATINVETARQHWRNVHKFSDYKKFSVKSESTVAK